MALLQEVKWYLRKGLLGESTGKWKRKVTGICLLNIWFIPSKQQQQQNGLE